MDGSLSGQCINVRVVRLNRAPSAEFTLQLIVVVIGHAPDLVQNSQELVGIHDAVARAIAADEMHREVPFTIKVDGHFEVGRIDLLIREGGTITVIDWKSDFIEPGGEEAKAEMAHAGQANAYARALRLTVPSLPVKEVIFVFARTGGQAVIQLEPDALF